MFFNRDLNVETFGELTHGMVMNSRY